MDEGVTADVLTVRPTINLFIFEPDILCPLYVDRFTAVDHDHMMNDDHFNRVQDSWFCISSRDGRRLPNRFRRGWNLRSRSLLTMRGMTRLCCFDSCIV